MTRPSRTRSGDEGTSLAELLVSILVFALVGGIVTTAVMVTLNTSRATTTRAADLGDAQAALDAMSKVIQTAAQPPAVEGAVPATAIITATANDLKFYGYNSPGAGPSQIEFSVVNGSLRETLTPATNSGANACMPPYQYGASTTRVLATGINSTAPVFSYFAQPTGGAQAGVALPLSPGTPPSLSSDERAALEIVAIDLSVAEPSHPTVTATEAKITVSLPNHLVLADSLPDAAC